MKRGSYMKKDCKNYCHKYSDMMGNNTDVMGMEDIMGSNNCVMGMQGMMDHNGSVMGMEHMMEHQHEDLIEALQHCESVCEHSKTMIKRRHGCEGRMMQLSLLHDCADICMLTAKFVARMSMYDRSIAGLCANICQCCGQECAKFSDHHSQHCAMVCLHCARLCYEFAMGH